MSKVKAKYQELNQSNLPWPEKSLMQLNFWHKGSYLKNIALEPTKLKMFSWIFQKILKQWRFMWLQREEQIFCRWKSAQISQLEWKLQDSNSTSRTSWSKMRRDALASIFLQEAMTLWPKAKAKETKSSTASTSFETALKILNNEWSDWY